MGVLPGGAACCTDLQNGPDSTAEAAESGALRRVMTIPPSPVHPARPWAGWTWILSNHSAKPAFGGLGRPGENGRRYSNTLAASGASSLLPGPAEPR